MRVAFFDLETTDLSALMGRVLCCSVAGLEGGVKTLRGDRAPYRTEDAIDDSKLVVAIRDTLEQADMVVGWNSKMFDIPFLNARLAKHGERPLRPHFNLDLMYYAGGTSMRIGSRKLDNVAKYFNFVNQKTPITWEDWQRAGAGDKNAMNQVVAHCEADILVLREAYDHLLPYVSTIHR